MYLPKREQKNSPLKGFTNPKMPNLQKLAPNQLPIKCFSAHHTSLIKGQVEVELLSLSQPSRQKRLIMNTGTLHQTALFRQVAPDCWCYAKCIQNKINEKGELHPRAMEALQTGETPRDWDEPSWLEEGEKSLSYTREHQQMLYSQPDASRNGTGTLKWPLDTDRMCKKTGSVYFNSLTWREIINALFQQIP